MTMFWGLIMEPQKRYSQTVQKPFHVSMASLDLSSSDDEFVQVMCCTDNHKYLICTLHKANTLQCPLDLNFNVGDQISFITNGNSHVHLSGYLIEDEFDELDEVEEEEDDHEITASNIVTGKRPKVPSKGEKLPPAKKMKTMELLDQFNTSQDDESDEDFADMMLNEDDDSESGEEDSNEEADDDDDEEVEEEEADDDEDESAEEEDSDEDEEEEEKEVKVQKKQNGTASKKEKETQQSKKSKAELVKVQSKGADLNNSAKQPKTPQKKTVEGGVVIEDLRVGNGPEAKAGKLVTVFYEGRLKTTNKMFDSSTKTGFNFRLGRGEVIKGWDIGVAGMKIGGKRRLICPPNVAYGKKGSPPTIPPNASLVFDVELLKIK